MNGQLLTGLYGTEGINQQTTFSSFFPQSNIAGGGEGYILHIYMAGGREGYILHIYMAGGGEGYILHFYMAGGGEGYILHIYCT
jgi:hypothetical protein